MCGIFGAVVPDGIDIRDVRALAHHSQQRGRDSSGMVLARTDGYQVLRADFPLARLVRKVDLKGCPAFFGHSRLVTNGTADNQPVMSDDGILVVHNGIIVNHDELWASTGRKRQLEIDSEIVAALTSKYLTTDGDLEALPQYILGQVKGVAACAIAIPSLGKLVLFSNNGSMYVGSKNGGIVFASESYGLTKIGATDINDIREVGLVVDIPDSMGPPSLKEWRSRSHDLVPGLGLSSAEEGLLVHPEPDVQRCTRCILPETMPYIRFDERGVCNYCHNYTPRNVPRPKSELLELIEPYRRNEGLEVIVPFSGGRDSCFGLHLIVEELGLRPVTYTYDWGMVTDLGRRNISRMSAELGVENIIVAADITRKRQHIRKNLTAWLKSPHLGMLSVLTAGDKHFFRHIESIKKQTGVGLNLWGINPLEVTHFKAGFLGVPPDFEEERVYSHGARKQLRYQRLRFGAMLESPGYFNTSLWDTLSGEYYRSFTEKSDYFHVFDYWRWDEHEIDSTLEKYDWERATDTSTTWRIGDGTAAFYNYAYHTIAGFTEHDTFRSNQIREGEITRGEALALAREENAPRYPNIKWYLDVLGLEFQPVIKTINEARRLY